MPRECGRGGASALRRVKASTDGFFTMPFCPCANWPFPYGRQGIAGAAPSCAENAWTRAFGKNCSPVCGAWGAPVKLFDDGRREGRLSGAVGIDGGLRLGYESASAATNSAGEVSLGATEVRTRFVPAFCDLAVVEDGFSFSTDEFAAGEVVSLTVKAANLGFWSATDATVKVYEEKDGDTVIKSEMKDPEAVKDCLREKFGVVK